MSKLPKPKFNLRVAKAKSETLISLVFRYHGKKLVYSTGHSILPKDWDNKLQRPIIQKRRPDLLAIKRHLDDLESFCTDVFIDSDYGKIEIRDFKKRLDSKFNPPASQDSVNDIPTEEVRPNFLEFLDLEISEMFVHNSNSDSVRMFKNHVEIIKKFAKETGTFDYDAVDWNFRLKLIDWLGQRNIQLAYGNKTLNVLRQFMERARRKGFHQNVRYQGPGWSIPKKKAKGQPVILNPRELQVLADLKLFGLAEAVRDLFLIGAGTGQRFSDYSRYNPNHFYRTSKGIPILSIISKKTETPCKVPLNTFPWLLPILKKYQFHSPKVSMQKLNENIKDICKKAGLDDKVLKVGQYMGRKPRIEKSYVPKFGEISSHTCRRSFATNLYQMGYRLSQIMPMTGHSTESQLRAYIGVDAEENAETVALEMISQRKLKTSENRGQRTVIL